MKTIKLIALGIILTGMIACSNEQASKEGENTEATATETNTGNSKTMSNNANNNASTAATNNESNVDPATAPVMSFEETNYDFGKINEGDIVNHTFKFTNTGKSDLVISNARGSCGCTVPSYPKEPIKPGEQGEILVSFNSKGKSGMQKKSVTITANTVPPTNMLYINSEVNKADDSDAASK